MNPLRKERKENNSHSPRASYDQVFGRSRFLSSFTRPALSLTPTPRVSPAPSHPCAPQLYEPYIDNHYVAFHRKKGPIGYVGVYRGKHNCMYRFNYINDHDYDGNKYLFKQVPPRNAISGSNINNSMKERVFSIYEKDGTKINTFIFIARRKNILLFEAEDFSTFRCEINEYNYELDLDENREMERLEIKERERRSEREMEREKDLEEKIKQKIKEEHPSSNNGSNHSRTKRKVKTTKVLQKLRMKGINMNALNNVTGRRILKRALNYENAGSSESSPNYNAMIPKELSKLEIPPMIRLNSDVSPLTAAASYSLERAGIYPDISNYGARLQKKRNEIRRRSEYLNLNRGSSNNNTNSKRTSKAKELMRKTIKKLLPKVRSRLKARS